MKFRQKRRRSQTEPEPFLKLKTCCSISESSCERTDNRVSESRHRRQPTPASAFLALTGHVTHCSPLALFFARESAPTHTIQYSFNMNYSFMKRCDGTDRNNNRHSQVKVARAPTFWIMHGNKWRDDAKMRKEKLKQNEKIIIEWLMPVKKPLCFYFDGRNAVKAFAGWATEPAPSSKSLNHHRCNQPYRLPVPCSASLKLLFSVRMRGSNLLGDVCDKHPCECEILNLSVHVSLTH